MPSVVIRGGIQCCLCAARIWMLLAAAPEHSARGRHNAICKGGSINYRVVEALAKVGVASICLLHPRCKSVLCTTVASSKDINPLASVLANAFFTRCARRSCQECTEPIHISRLIPRMEGLASPFQGQLRHSCIQELLMLAPAARPLCQGICRTAEVQLPGVLSLRQTSTLVLSSHRIGARQRTVSINVVVQVGWVAILSSICQVQVAHNNHSPSQGSALLHTLLQA
mmetsp:Transcript_13399/g.31461  ORF Transcript_13399/g.31461 Transcript_13399/m.31461 type:complete len:227 (-) Transcript_13399:655-1335(-)